MAIVDLVMPKMGESIMEATILKWHKQPGDAVRQDETVLDIATDKVDTEVPSPVGGVIETVLFQVNDVVPVGAVIARLKTTIAEDSKPAPDTAAPDTKRETPEHAGAYSYVRPDLHEPMPAEPEPKQAVSASATQTDTALKPNDSGNRFYSPLVLTIAGNEGIALSELERIAGTGNEGRVTKKDILSYVSGKKNGTATGMQPPSNGNGFRSDRESTVPAPGSERSPVPSSPATANGSSTAKEAAQTGNVEIIEMDRMRRLIADHMVRSKQTSPHVTSFSEADVTNMVLWREKEKVAFEKREGTKLTITPLFLEAIVRTLKRFPMMNSSLQGNNIVIKKDINIGMATALPNGNLIVPVIRNADSYNRVGLARQVNQLAAQAREGKLRPDDIQDGTFTVTNVGIFGSLMGVPIINQPQVAILATGAIKKRAVVIETEQGDTIGIRHMMYLSMSYDHRIVDGALGASFLTAVAREMEAFAG